MRDLFGIEGDAFPPEARVAAVEGTESLSEPYAFSIDLALPGVPESDFEAGATIGQRVSLTISDDTGTVRNRIHGIVAAAELVHEVPSHALYRVDLVPEVWLLSLGRHGRVFVDQSSPAIVEMLLREGGLRSPDQYELRLLKSYPSREHVCQYGESNFDFISRLCEREGIYYFFEQGDRREKLIFTDDKSKHRKLDSEPVLYFPLLGERAHAPEAFYTFRCRHASMPQKLKVTDHDYMHPEMPVSEEAPVDEGGTGEQWFFGENFIESGVGRRLARVRAEGLLVRRELFCGTGRTFEVRAGYKFKLDDHPRSDMNQDYLAVTVRHRGVQAGAKIDALRDAGAPERSEYRVEVVAIAADTQFRAARKTPTPRIYGLEGGVIDGPANEDYAQIDSEGRYFVKLRFDESGLKDGKASTRVRMLQPHAGNPEGMHFPLRKGTEVAVAFMGGDPDRPVIAGAVANPYNPNMVSDYNRTQNVIQTGGSTRIEIEDEAEKQYIDMSTLPKKTALHLGAPSDPLQRKHNFELRTDGSGLIHTGEDHHVEVDGKVEAKIGKGLDETISGGVMRRVDGGLTEILKHGGMARRVEGGITEFMTGELRQSANQGVFIGTPQKVQISGDAGIWLETNGEVTVTSPHGIHTLTQGKRSEQDQLFERISMVANEIVGELASIVGMAGETVATKGSTIGKSTEVVVRATSVAMQKFETTHFKYDRTKFIDEETPIHKKNGKIVIETADTSVSKADLHIVD